MFEIEDQEQRRGDIDRALAKALARIDARAPATPLGDEAGQELAAFQRYTRALVPGGGFRIGWVDQQASASLDFLRSFTWVAASGLAVWALLFKSPWPLLDTIPSTMACSVLIAFIVRRKFKKSHSIEIRPDGMIVDGRFFSIEGFGEEWPRLQWKGDDENRLVLSGIYGTRFIEFVTANRFDLSDRTPERLAEDLALAMEQLWGRRDAIVATP
jgi:hypothetical protein